MIVAIYTYIWLLMKVHVYELYNTDLTITTKKLMELFAPVDSKKVDKLESYLRLPQPEIDRIQKDYQSPIQRKEAYLDLYVHQYPCPSWSQIAEVLRYGIVLPQQAAFVKNIYIEGIYM